MTMTFLIVLCVYTGPGVSSAIAANRISSLIHVEGTSTTEVAEVWLKNQHNSQQLGEPLPQWLWPYQWPQHMAPGVAMQGPPGERPGITLESKSGRFAAVHRFEGFRVKVW